MTTQATIFDAIESNHRKTVGMQQAASFPFDEPVARARNIAIYLAKAHGEVTADMVHEYLAEKLPDVLGALQPASWGSVMRSPRLRFTGRITESKRIARHSGSQRIWAYDPLSSQG